MKYSATDLNKALGISYPVASGMLTLFEEIGIVKLVAKRTPPGGKGKKVKVYEIPDSFTFDFSRIVELMAPFRMEKTTGIYTEVPVTATATSTEAEADDNDNYEVEAALSRLAEAV